MDNKRIVLDRQCVYRYKNEGWWLSVSVEKKRIVLDRTVRVCRSRTGSTSSKNKKYDWSVSAHNNRIENDDDLFPSAQLSSLLHCGCAFDPRKTIQTVTVAVLRSWIAGLASEWMNWEFFISILAWLIETVWEEDGYFFTRYPPRIMIETTLLAWDRCFLSLSALKSVNLPSCIRDDPVVKSVPVFSAKSWPSSIFGKIEFEG